MDSLIAFFFLTGLIIVIGYVTDQGLSNLEHQINPGNDIRIIGADARDKAQKLSEKYIQDMANMLIRKRR